MRGYRPLLLALFGLGMLACASQTVHPPAPLRFAEMPEAWTFSARYEPKSEQLDVEARFPGGASADMVVAAAASRFITDLRVLDHQTGTWSPALERKRHWVAPACSSGMCTLRYRFALGQAVDHLRGWHGTERYGSMLLISPSAWLVRPRTLPAGIPFALQVQKPADYEFITSFVNRRGDVFVGQAKELRWFPLSILGRAEVEERSLAGGIAVVVRPEEGLGVDPVAFESWLQRGLEGVTAYFGRFPIARAIVLLRSGRWHGIYGGSAYGHGGGIVKLWIGRRADPDTFRDDWQLTHELVHLAFPNVERQHRWMEEGLATYLEPLIRTRQGVISEDQFWREMIEGMPNGLPNDDDLGFDHDTSWGELYWGGALYYMLADIRIRERTAGKRSLDDALKGILGGGGDIRASWSLERIFGVSLESTGVPVLAELYQRMGESAHDVDLSQLWRALGVKIEGNRVLYDAKAPLARVREELVRASQ